MSKTILVVESNEDIREMLLLQLSSIDRTFDILALGNEERALVWLKLKLTHNFNERVDILIIAREMLGIPVEEVVKTAKSLRPAIRIVVTTTSPYKDQTISIMMRAGADVVLWKPWDVKELREALQV